MKKIARILPLLLCLLWGGGCTHYPIARPHIVLICLDGLSVDRLALMHGTVIAPTLEKLAREGVNFDCAFSQSNEPLYSEGSLLTSCYPSEIAPLVPKAFVLREDQLTLPKILHMYGYTCAGFYGDLNLSAAHGFSGGFAQYTGEPHCGSLFHLVPASVRWMKENLSKTDADGHPMPLFVYIESTDCLHTDAKRDAARRTHRELPDLSDIQMPKEKGGDHRRGRRSHREGDVVSADGYLRDLLTRMAAIGMDSTNTLFIVTSSCGNVKSRSLASSLHVPLIVSGSGVSITKWGSHAPPVVGPIDLLPTVLSRTGIAIPAQVRGHDLSPWIDPPQAPPVSERACVFAETPTYAAAIHAGWYALFVEGFPGGSLQMVARLRRPPGIFTNFKFYALLQDPKNPIPPDVPLVTEMQRRLLAVEEQSVAIKRTYVQRLDAVTIHEIQAHGYWIPDSGGRGPKK